MTTILLLLYCSKIILWMKTRTFYGDEEQNIIHVWWCNSIISIIWDTSTQWEKFIPVQIHYYIRWQKPGSTKWIQQRSLLSLFKLLDLLIDSSMDIFGDFHNGFKLFPALVFLTLITRSNLLWSSLSMGFSSRSSAVVLFKLKYSA